MISNVPTPAKLLPAGAVMVSRNASRLQLELNERQEFTRILEG